MDKQETWKKTDDIEIDLADMLRGFCRKWKQAAVLAVLCAVILDGYGWMKNRENSGGNKPDADYSLEETELSKEEYQLVEAAADMEQEVRGLGEYLENSVLMQIDPFHKNTVTMLYSIEDAGSRDLQKIMESYLGFLLNGTAVSELKNKSAYKKMDKSCLAELMNAYQKMPDYPYQIAAERFFEEGMPAEALLYVEVTGKDAKMALQLAKDLQEVIEDSCPNVKKTAGSHRLILLSSEKKETADGSLQAWQHDKRAVLSSYQSALKTMTDAFNEAQKSAYRNAADLEEIQKAQQNETEESGHFYGSVRYGLIGMIAGIFIYGCLFAFRYLFQDTLKSENEIKGMYTFPFYGSILLKKGDTAVFSEEAGTQMMHMLGRVRLTCKKQEIKKICMASDFTLHIQEKACLEAAQKQLENWGIHAVIAENASQDMAVWDTLTETGTVLMVCRIGTTTHHMVNEAMRFYQENDIAAAGAMAFIY